MNDRRSIGGRPGVASAGVEAAASTVGVALLAEVRRARAVSPSRWNTVLRKMVMPASVRPRSVRRYTLGSPRGRAMMDGKLRTASESLAHVFSERVSQHRASI